MAAVTLTGQVVDVDTNNPLPGVTITDLSNPVNDTETAADGTFKLTVLNVTVGIQIAADGYSTVLMNGNNPEFGTIYLGRLDSGVVSLAKADIKNNPVKWGVIFLVVVVIVFFSIRFKIWRKFL